jgi:ferrochelatase
MQQLIAKGVRNLAVACPSFVFDCLETLEEIGMRGKETWLELGGKQFTLVPCLNNNRLWIKAVVNFVHHQEQKAHFI